MSFLHPEFLYFMLPPVFILFALLMTQKESQASFFSEDVMQKLRVSANTLTLKARNALFFLMSVLLVIALADPVIKEGEIEIKAKSADIMLALDISDSMLAEDLYPNRLKLAKQKALKMLKMLENERVGVVAFAKNAYLVSPWSHDHDAVAFLLRQLDTDFITEQGTNFLSMLKSVDDTLKKENKKYLVILSDGGDQKSFDEEIAYAKEHHITVFVLGVATHKGSPIKKRDGSFVQYNGKIVVSKLNENIAQLATQTSGVYIEATITDDDVKAMVHELEIAVEKKELDSKKIQKYIPLFYYPLGLAMILLLIATSSMSKRVQVGVPSMVIFMLLSLHVTDSQAGVLEFMELNKAKNAYEQGEYKKAAKIYEKFAKEHDNAQGYYNAANAYYKQKRYKSAIENYKKAIFSNQGYKANKWANLGNAYSKVGAKQEDIDTLEKGKKAYEESLKYNPKSEDVKANLQQIQQLIKRLKKKKKQQQKGDKNKNNKDKKGKKNQKNQQKNGAKKEKNQQNKGQKSKQQKDEKTEQKEASKDTKEKKKNEGKNTKQKGKKKNESKEKKQGKKSDEVQMKKIKMSDAEERKWMQRLQQKQKTFLYRISDDMQRGGDDEKPW